MSKAAIDHQQLENLTHEELIVLVKALFKENGELKARLAALEAELAKLKKPPATSRNSSQPPSRDPNPEVSPTNNACEQALRPSVIHRKGTSGFRSEWAEKAYAAVTTEPRDVSSSDKCELGV